MAYEEVETCRWDKLCEKLRSNINITSCVWLHFAFINDSNDYWRLRVAVAEQLNLRVVVLRFLKYWVTGKETSILGKDEKYAILFPENGGRMIVWNNDHHHHQRSTVYEDEDHRPQYLWCLLTPTVTRAVLLRLVEWWTGKPLEKSGRHLIVILEDVRKTTKSSGQPVCRPSFEPTNLRSMPSLFWDVMRSRLVADFDNHQPTCPA